MKTQVERPEWSQSVEWIETSLETLDGNMEEVKREITLCSNEPQIYRDSVMALSASLPTCSYTESPVDSKRVEEATRNVLDLLKDRAALLTSLLQDKSGEAVVRERIQRDKHLLNVEAVIFTGMTVVQDLKRRLEDNLKTQSTLLRQLEVGIGGGCEDRASTRSGVGTGRCLRR